MAFEEQNLLAMLDIIQRSLKSRMLACSLWEFFGHNLRCRRPTIDLNASNSVHIEIESFLDSRRFSDLQPEVVVRRNARQEAGLVHELLHLNLIPLGFPRFRLWTDDDETWNIAGGFINIADHVPMLPTFVDLGYDEREFLGSVSSPGPRELRVKKDVEKLKPFLLAPNDYGHVVSEYLSRHAIKHEAVWIADLARRG
jgi:hypothetical protein